MKPSRRLAGALLAVVVAAFAGSAPANASEMIGPSFLEPQSQTVPLPTFRLSAVRALAIADRLAAVTRARKADPQTIGVAYIDGPATWELDYVNRVKFHKGPALPQVQVIVNGTTGRILHVWSGRQAGDYEARGHFSPEFDQPWLWALLCVAFLAPFVDLRRPRRMLHLDLLVLLSFGISYLFYFQAKVTTSVPLVYPVLVYLLARMIVAARRPRERREPLVPHLPTWALAAGLLLLVGLRIGLNIDGRQVIDAGAAGVVGAYRMLHHLPLWGHSPGHADTYGPVVYLAYIPFELVFPWHGRWTGTLAAAHAASITFDLLTLLGLYVLGVRLRSGRPGRRLGLALAYAWAAFPFTLFPLVVNTNDALISMFLVWALVAIASPAGRGALVGLAAAAKFVPVALVPLFAVAHKRSRRDVALAGAASAAASVGVILLYLPKDGGVATFWNATIGFQLTRDSNFSLWTLHPSLAWLQVVLEVLAVAVVVAIAFLPRRRDTRQTAALAATALIATALPTRYWFYFYIVWFLPFVLAALLGEYSTVSRRREPDEIETAAIVGAADRALR